MWYTIYGCTEDQAVKAVDFFKSIGTECGKTGHGFRQGIYSVDFWCEEEDLSTLQGLLIENGTPLVKGASPRGYVTDGDWLEK